MRRPVKLFLCGDVMTGRGVDRILPHPGVPELHEPYARSAELYVTLAERRNGPIPRPVAPDYVWGDALEVWDELEPDLRIVNLETGITISDEYWPGKGIHYRMAPDNVTCLSAARLDCCVLANNHVLDWGYAGLAETLTTLHDAGIATAGAGRDAAHAARPARLGVDGDGDVLVFGYAARSSGVPAEWRAAPERAGINLLPDLSRATAVRVAEALRERRGSEDIAIASIHWGGNWGYDVTDEQRDFAHALIDRGAADLVHGHSSHHPIAIEIYRDKLILYGCGDFLNDYEGIGGYDEYRPWLAPMYFPTLEPESGTLSALDIVPLEVRRMRLGYTAADDRRWLAETLTRLGRAFADDVAFVEEGRRIVVSGRDGVPPVSP